tara:strand:- start:546 stop:938 length:393 start_codon:yes stop_codon:yes gene_type:complete
MLNFTNNERKNNVMSKFSKKPINEWKYGEEFERYISSSLSLRDIASLKNEFFTTEMARALRELYNALLDIKALGKKCLQDIGNLSLGYIVSLEDELFTIKMTRAFDTLYYGLLDNKALRNKWLKEREAPR